VLFLGFDRKGAAASLGIGVIVFSAAASTGRSTTSYDNPATFLRRAFAAILLSTQCRGIYGRPWLREARFLIACIARLQVGAFHIIARHWIILQHKPSVKEPIL
jgi:hypothetical protein